MDAGGRVNQERKPTIEQLAGQLAGLDPVRVGRRAQVVYDLTEGAYEFQFVGRPARLWPREQAACWTDVEPAAALKPLQFRIALTYLLTARATGGPEGAWEPAEDVPPETRRALEAALGRDAASLIRAARRLGGRRSQIGEFAAEVPLLPRVRVRISFHETGEADARQSRIEWSRHAAGHLPPDMLAALLDMAVTRLIAAAQ